MKKIVLAAIILLGLLSLAAGAAKIVQAPAEVAFFKDAGVALTWLVPLGALQVLGALALLVPRVRRIGLAMIALGFAISSAMIFATGASLFGAISLIPAAIAFALYMSLRQPV